MAASSLCNFLSFSIPSQQPQITKKPPPQIISAPSFSDSLPTLSSSSSSSSSSVSFQDRSKRNGFIPVTPIEKSSLSSSRNDLLSVICPSLAYSNTLFFSAYNVQVVVEEDESEESLIRRFKREAMRARVIQDCRRRRYFENKQDEKKRRTREAAKKNKRRKTPWRDDQEEQALKEEEEKKAKEEDDDDNWELPDGDLPY